MPMMSNLVAYWPLKTDTQATTGHAISPSASTSPSASASPSASSSPSASASASPSAPAYAPFGGHASLTTNLISYWALGEETGHTRYDSVDASSYDLLDVNANTSAKLPVTRSASGGPSGQPSAYFPGIKENAGELGRPYLGVPFGSAMYANSGTLEPELTFNCWFKSVAGSPLSPRANMLVGISNSLNFTVYTQLDGQVTAMISGWYDGAWKSSSVGFTPRGDASVNPAMCTLVYSTAAGVAPKIYLNGVDQSAAGNAVTGGFTALGGGVYPDVNIGTRTDAYVNALGYISHAAIWHRALTAREIQDLYNNGTGLLY